MRFLFYTEFYAESEFFLRLAMSLKKLGIEPTFLSPNFSEYLKAKKYGFDSIFLLGFGRSTTHGDFERVSFGRDVICQSQTVRGAANKYRAITEEISKWTGANESEDILCIWNGLNSAGLAVSDAAELCGCKTLYFELANLPGKIFCDPRGVNAASSLMEEASWPSIDNVCDLEPLYAQWSERYIDSKTKNHSVPQSKFSHQVPLRAVVDHCVATLSKCRTISIRYALNRARNLMVRRAGRSPVQPSPGNSKIDDYVFFPMQVSTDTQVILNSDLNLWESLDQALEIAKQESLPLLVKPHPAEQDPEIAAKLDELSNNGALFIVSGNTFNWIKGAKKVVTINSTVGLEALILDKNVQFLGRTFFKKITSQAKLSWYICEYLIEADYFDSKSSVSKSSCKKIISRAYQ